MNGLGWDRGLAAGELSVAAITGDAPHCAGVILVRDGRLLVALGGHKYPPPDPAHPWRVGEVGGGMEAGETAWETAVREAREETGLDVDLVAADVTYAYDRESGALTEVGCVDRPAPYSLSRWAVDDPTTPYQPGLPVGPYAYAATFLAEADGDPVPGDDADILLWVPLDRFGPLRDWPTLREVVEAGGELVTPGPVDLDQGVWVDEDEDFFQLAPLLAGEVSRD